MHPCLTLETLRMTRDKWDFDILIDNPNFEWSWVREFPDELWAWDMMHTLSSFQWKWIEEFPDKPWNWFEFNPPLEFVFKFRHKPFNWRIISMNKTIHDILAYPDIPWDWEYLTIHSDIDTDDMIRYDHFPWDIETLSFTSIGDYTMKYVIYFQNRFNQLAWNDFSSVIHFHTFKQYIHLNWQTQYIRFNQIVYEDDFVNIILERGFDNWNWKFLSRWVHVSAIKKYNMFPWQEFEIIHNPTLQYEDLRYFHTLGNHPRAPCESLESVVRKWHSACVIQRAWRMCSTNPEYTVCKKQVNEFFADFMQKTANPCVHDTECNLCPCITPQEYS